MNTKMTTRTNTTVMPLVLIPTTTIAYHHKDPDMIHGQREGIVIVIAAEALLVAHTMGRAATDLHVAVIVIEGVVIEGIPIGDQIGETEDGAEMLWLLTIVHQDDGKELPSGFQSFIVDMYLNS
jgi:hypothetical protein